MTDVPEQVFIDAAEVWARAFFPAESDEVIAYQVPGIAATPNFRAAVASAYRAGRRSVAAELREIIESQSSWLWLEVGERALEQVAQRIERTTHTGQAATPDGPRRWAHHVPAEPGPDVLAVQIVETGQRWERRYAKDQPDRWAWGHWLLEWSQLLSAWAVGHTLIDVTPAQERS
jgi:hypothetical protein